MSQEMDISWQVLRRIAKRWGGETAEPAEVKPLDGGCINTTVAITLEDTRKAVLKISAYRVDRSYEIEAHQLGLLAALGLPAPKVYDVHIGSLDDPYSYILMEFLEGVDLYRARKACTAEQYDDLQSQLAEMMLLMHSETASEYRRVLPNGDAISYDAWPEFYRAIFNPIWDEVKNSPHIPIKSRKQIGKIHDRLDRLLLHDDLPRLVHWDIWATNVLANPDDSGRWKISAILDPSCKYAHAEAELAYMSLFQTTTPAFSKAYQRDRKLTEEYHRVRKPIYQMYFLMNHVHIFGAEYAKALVDSVDKISS
jgi:fructosamine-3-kinase